MSESSGEKLFSCKFFRVEFPYLDARMEFVYSEVAELRRYTINYLSFSVKSLTCPQFQVFQTVENPGVSLKMRKTSFTLFLCYTFSAIKDKFSNWKHLFSMQNILQRLKVLATCSLSAEVQSFWPLLIPPVLFEFEAREKTYDQSISFGSGRWIDQLLNRSRFFCNAWSHVHIIKRRRRVLPANWDRTETSQSPGLH